MCKTLLKVDMLIQVTAKNDRGAFGGHIVVLLLVFLFH